MHGVTAILGAEAAAITAMDLKRSDASSLTERQDNVVTTPCWEAPDGQVHCSIGKRQDVVATSPCWEGPDGQVHCHVDKRQDNVVTTPCWEAPDGQVHCSVGKREEVVATSPLDKRQVVVTTPCWEAPDGQVHCHLQKRQDNVVTTPCWEAPDGQIHCHLEKRQRVVYTGCWETTDGKVRCAAHPRPPHEKRQVVVTTPCWEGPDGQVHCAASKDKREELAEAGVYPSPSHVANGTTLDCASWWTVPNTTAQADLCLAALVSAQNISFAQFRQLNPDVDPTCSNLKIGGAYCVQGASDAASITTVGGPNDTAPSSVPLPPASRVTEARTSIQSTSHPTPTFIADGLPVSSQPVTIGDQTSASSNATTRSASAPSATITRRPSTECLYASRAKFSTSDRQFGDYLLDAAGHTCGTQIPPDGLVDPSRLTHATPPPPLTTQADTDVAQTSSRAASTKEDYSSLAQATASSSAAASDSSAGAANSTDTAPRLDGRCGLDEFSQATCDPDGEYGGCCSSHGYCGKTNDHCGVGCLNGCNLGSSNNTLTQATPEGVESSTSFSPPRPQITD
ncbi:MAG: hypothetical protein Q9213_004417 [Squamulea squamosa]